MISLIYRSYDVLMEYASCTLMLLNYIQASPDISVFNGVTKCISYILIY